MTLFVNRFKHPLHVFDLTLDEVEDLHVDRPRYAVPAAHESEPNDTVPESLCGTTVREANDRMLDSGDMLGGHDHVLRVAHLRNIENLEAFVHDARLCDDCRRGLPEVWPAAKPHVVSYYGDEDEDGDEGEDGDEDRTLGELFG
jgi:hypothetical protein